MRERHTGRVGRARLALTGRAAPILHGELMRWLRAHWKATLIASVLFVLGIGIGAGGGATTATADTVTEVRTETVDAEPVTVTTTRVRTLTRTPPNRGVKVSYTQEQWADLFRISGAHVVNDFEGHALVRGQLTYLGGGSCELDYVAVQGTFFDSAGDVVGTGLWNEDGGMPENAGVPMEVSGDAERTVSRAELVVTDADCAD